MSQPFKAPLRGILRCHDLVTLYYGFPMVTAVREQQLYPDINTITQLFPQDPRRIRYEIILANADPASQTVVIGTQPSFDAQTGQFYNILPGGTLIITREFLDDLDAVTLGLNFEISSTNITVSTRETFLTPPPLDELGDALSAL